MAIIEIDTTSIVMLINDFFIKQCFLTNNLVNTNRFTMINYRLSICKCRRLFLTSKEKRNIFIVFR